MVTSFLVRRCFIRAILLIDANTDETQILPLSLATFALAHQYYAIFAILDLPKIGV